jgi:hypothetical protein
MGTMFTFRRLRPSAHRVPPPAIALAVLLIAMGVAAPGVACDKSPPGWIAGAPGDPQSVATFTGEFVNGTPVYRLPAITVVSRRPAEVAKTQRDDARPRRTRSRTGSTPAPAGKVASAQGETTAIKPCIG